MSGAANKDNTRAEEFKRATAGVLRAIAEQPDVQVAFQPGPSGVSGKRARLPLPTRALPLAEMAKLRGQSDAIALRIRHHDDAVHAQRMPARKEAKDAFDALEQVRVEVIGAQHMLGVDANLRAKLTEECEADGFDRMTRRDQLPIDKALALLARERMSGEPSPEPARRILDMWRDTLGDNADQALAEMSTAKGNQQAFAKATRKLLAALELAEAEVESDQDDNSEDGEDGGEQSGEQDNSEDGDGQSQSESESMLGAQPEEMEGKRPTTTDRSRKKKPRSRKATTGPAAHSPGASVRTRTAKPSTRPIPANTMRKSRRKIFATRTSSAGCASSSISSCSICKA